MKYLAKLLITLVLSLLVGALIDGAHAAASGSARASRSGARVSKKHSKKSAKISSGGDALKRKTNLKFDGRSIESLRAGKYDSLSLGDEGAKGAKRLYSLPANFAPRAADSETEMRYRQ
jgi:hypothetical protein